MTQVIVYMAIGLYVGYKIGRRKGERKMICAIFQDINKKFQEVLKALETE